jgi:peptide/nickel transport system substrate-binding protein
LIHEVAPKDLQILDQADGVVVESIDGTFWEYIGLNCAQPPFDRVAVRQAVARAVDRAVINQLVKFGQATVLDGGPIPPNHWAYADLHLFPEQNLAQASKLLAEADVATPIEVELIVDSSVTYQARAAEVVKQQLAEVGFQITVRGLESSVFFDRLGKGEFQMTLVGWMGFVDPDQWTWNLFHSAGKYNQQQYANNAVDQLLDRGRAVLDRDQRIDIYREAQRIIALDAPMVFLYVNPQTSAWRQSLHGYGPHPTATTIGLRDAWLDEPD